MTIFVYQLGHHRTTSKVITKKTRLSVSLSLIRFNAAIPSSQILCLTFEVATGVAVSTDSPKFRHGFRIEYNCKYKHEDNVKTVIHLLIHLLFFFILAILLHCKY